MNQATDRNAGITPAVIIDTEPVKIVVWWDDDVIRVTEYLRVKYYVYPTVEDLAAEHDLWPEAIEAVRALQVVDPD